jgi:isopentenyl diphosphate isomerase/L-lactate dehydrogenase-like FMN-dependent dehydrogenase
MNRRQALLRFCQFLAASPILRADKKYSELTELLKQVNVFDFEKIARAKLDPVAWDYLDEGSDDESSLRANRGRFENFIIRPHPLLHDIASIDTSTTLFGQSMLQPFYLSVTGGKNCFVPNGEQETALASATANAMMITAGAISDVIDSGKGPKLWWQFTTASEFRNKKQMADFANRLEGEGCSAISVTVDIYVVSHRERSMHNGLVRSWCQMRGIPRNAKGELAYQPDDVLWTAGDMPRQRPLPTPTWDTLQQLREVSKIPVVVKGIMAAEDTELAVKHGLSGVIVSNHGGRQLDQVGATIEALPECVKAANGKIPVLVDGGFRRGTDMFKALALGASAVGIGRPYLWGLAAFGQPGVVRIIEILRAEMAAVMGMAGTAKVSQIDRSFVRVRA